MIVLNMVFQVARRTVARLLVAHVARLGSFCGSIFYLIKDREKSCLNIKYNQILS